MILLTKKQIIEMHELLIESSGGLKGVKDHALLDSAINNPFQTFMGEELYPTIQKKAASLCFGLINNHAFHDGNKRIGILAMLTFLELNGVDIECSDAEIVILGLNVASGKYTQKDVLKWIRQHYIY